MKTRAKWSWIFTGISITLIGVTRLLWAEVELCDLEKMAKAEPGYECQVKTQNENVIWQLHVKTASGKKVWKDMKSGLLVSDILDGKFTQYQAQDMCTNPSSEDARGNLISLNWSLPSGYPESFNGKKGFPNKDSDFETLEKNGIRKVIDTSGRYFWSSSVHPFFSSNAYFFNGSYGGIFNFYRGYDGRDDYPGSVLCVSR